MVNPKYFQVQQTTKRIGFVVISIYLIFLEASYYYYKDRSRSKNKKYSIFITFIFNILYLVIDTIKLISLTFKLSKGYRRILRVYTIIKLYILRVITYKLQISKI